jgi:hypothetical protein
LSKEYLRPGVFVEEVPPGEQPIQAVGTSTGAFIGIAEKGALNKPKLVTNWSQFVKDFGGHRRDSFLAHAVQGFFLNGGSRCFVVRVASATAAIASATLSDRAGAPLDTLGIQALNEGEWGNRLSLDVADGTKIPATEFMIIVNLDGEVVETWDDLSLDPEAENYIAAVVNDDSAYIQVTDLESVTVSPDNRPAVQSDVPLAGGADGVTDITDSDYVGNSADRTGLYAFDTVDEISNLCVPGVSTQTVVQAALDYCDGRGDCGFIVDSPEGGDPVSTKTFRELFDSSRGYYYFPRIKVLDPLTKRVKVVPPSGHIAGVFARSDGGRGVHKAPSNEVVRGAVGLEYEVTDGEQEILNPAGVNCIRVFRGRGIRIWGARTMSSEPALLHIHKRRFLMFVEESVSESTQWIVHEPSDERLWGKIVRSVSAFLRRQWLEGALFGSSEVEAYYVKCDAETNPPDVRAAFQVITEIGVNIVETAEFVIFRIAQWSGGRRISE